MISTIIQLAALAMIAVALFRESKRDRLSKLREKADLHALFHDLQASIAQNSKSTSSTIDAMADTILQISSDLSHALITIGNTSKCVSDNNVMLSQIRTIVTELNQLSIAVDDDLHKIHSRLLALETPVNIWGKAQTQYEIQKGQANRTLRGRIRDLDSTLIATRQTLKSQSDKIAQLNSQIESIQSAARDALAETMLEISAIRDWMDDSGIPKAQMDKHLALVFKDKVPSMVYDRIKNTENFQNALRDAVNTMPDHPREIEPDSPFSNADASV